MCARPPDAALLRFDSTAERVSSTTWNHDQFRRKKFRMECRFPVENGSLCCEKTCAWSDLLLYARRSWLSVLSTLMRKGAVATEAGMAGHGAGLADAGLAQPGP